MAYFFEDNEALNSNEIVREALDNVFFYKFRMEGYCDINVLLGKPRIAKTEIESKLAEMQSPLAKLFAGAYPKKLEDIVEKMLPVLNEMIKSREKDNKTDDFIYFAIIYYILQIYKSISDKINFILSLYDKWNGGNKEYDIKISNGIVFNASKVEVHFISSIKDYVGFMDEIRDDKNKLFFRGHSKTTYELQPSLFRYAEWLSNEKKMYLELLTRCPHEFEGLHSHIEKLAEMQHYGLPTRLLDITQNPLVALFFACELETDYRGEIIVFGINRDQIKYSQSDTVALLASLPLFTLEEQYGFYNASSKAMLVGSNCGNAVDRLVHEVRMERPGFVSAIMPEDLQGATVCIPAKQNKRIENQEGAFIVCGLVSEIYGSNHNQVNTLSNLRVRNKDGKIVICIVEKKSLILKQLDDLGVNKAKIYPEIDDVSDYIKTHTDQM